MVFSSNALFLYSTRSTLQHDTLPLGTLQHGNLPLPDKSSSGIMFSTLLQYSELACAVASPAFRQWRESGVAASSTMPGAPCNMTPSLCPPTHELKFSTQHCIA